MKKHILLILVLMSLCVMGIVGLQLFWNYQNYRTTVKTFDHDINEALHHAVARETNQRRDQIVTRFKGWLADTSLIIITADHKNRDSATVFYTQDAHPRFREDKKSRFQFGLTDFKEKLDDITPQTKALMIKHFGDRILKRDLKEGMVYHYTQMLGDSLEKVFTSSKMNPRALNKLFGQELAARNIHAAFTLDPRKTEGLYLTQKVNTNFRQPYKNDFVYAGIESPDTYFFKEMKWVIITSLLLIIITIGCFTYTVKTLLSQHKLAELKDAFINNMTHELNTPIASIKITAEALKTFSHSPQVQSEYLDMISYQSDKLQDLTAHILNTGRLNKNSDGWADVNLNELVAVAINDLKPQAESTGATINYKPSDERPSIQGDILSLRNVMVNLIDNALKYAIGRPAIAVEVMVSSNYAAIHITDNGVGIPSEYHSLVFERFFRVPQGNLHDVKGFGLGLSYVKAVVQQHHGEVAVRDNDPSGAVFTIRLPLK